MIDDGPLADGLAEFDDWLGPDLSEYLYLLSEVSEVLSEVVAVGCSLVNSHGELQVAAWTSDEVLHLERLQLQDRQGPGVDCFATGQPLVNISQTETQRRWPTITTKLIQTGFASIHTLPLHVDGHCIGVLNLYFKKYRVLSPAELSMCQAWIRVAGIKLQQSRPWGQQEAAHRPLGERYQVVKLIGHGGMANVHLARDLNLDRMVTIKTPRWDRMSQPSLVEQFRREGRAAARLKHPGIVSVLSTGDEEVTAPRGGRVQRPYIVMEHVTGETLRSLVSTGVGVRVEKALRITADILSALDYIHEHGIVHGDLTATNVMLSTDGTVKLMDFGSSHAFTGSDPNATQSVAVTPAYGSPERAQGLASDTRADLYSVGCVLYELLTGRVPFVGNSGVDLAYRHVHEAPQPPSTHQPEIGAQLDAVVLRALAKPPVDRYQSAQQFRRGLLAACSDAHLPDVELGTP